MPSGNATHGLNAAVTVMKTVCWALRATVLWGRSCRRSFSPSWVEVHEGFQVENLNWKTLRSFLEQLQNNHSLHQTSDKMWILKSFMFIISCDSRLILPLTCMNAVFLQKDKICQSSKPAVCSLRWRWLILKQSEDNTTHPNVESTLWKHSHSVSCHLCRWAGGGVGPAAAAGR